MVKYIFVLLAFYITIPLLNAQNPIVMGQSTILDSKILGEQRTINIYTPEGYAHEDTVKYPVIYIIDGGIEEDFFHIAGTVRFNTQPWINRFPKSIVVGIENTDRKRDCTFNVDNLDFVERMGLKREYYPSYGGSANYISFIETELQPFVSKAYHTSDARTVIGESFAGLLATEILLKHGHLFDTYIIISPSLWWGHEVLLEEAPSLLQSGNYAGITVYIGACDEAENKIMHEDAVALNALLNKYGGEKMKVIYDYLPDEIHSTLMHQAVYNAFKLIYPHAEYQK